VAVGFGISNRDQVVDVQRYADAVVVGSAIVLELERVSGESNVSGRIGEFVRELLPENA
jgi:tryptophan synthase alpha subunit